MNPILASSQNYRPFSRHVKSATFVLAASAAMLLGVDSAHAGAGELKALTAALNGVSPSAATDTQLAAAVVAASNANPKLKPGAIAGEALKAAGSAAPTVGAKIVQSAPQITSQADFNTNVDKQTAFAGLAAKTAGTGKGLNVTHVPEFVAALRVNALVISSSEALGIAKIAKASKVGAGAVLGGHARNLLDAADVQLLVDALSKTGGLSAAAKEVATAITTATSNPADFAEKAINGAASTLATKIVPGVVAGSPQNAGAIVDRVINLGGAATFGAGEAAARKGALALATAVGLVADIEEIRRVGTVLVASDVFSKVSQVTSVTKALAKAIMAKPISSTLNSPLTVINKRDELGELGAYVVGALVANSRFAGELANVKKTGSLIRGIIKAVVAAKAKAGFGPTLAEVATDVSGSVALTIANSPLLAPALKTVIQNYLLLDANISAIAGKANLAAVKTALQLGFSTTDATRNTRLEDGTVAQVNDPVTDIRNF